MPSGAILSCYKVVYKSNKNLAEDKYNAVREDDAISLMRIIINNVYNLLSTYKN